MNKKIYVDVTIFEKESFGRGIDRVISKFLSANEGELHAGKLIPVQWHEEYGYILATNTLRKYGKETFSYTSRLVQKASLYVVPNYILVKIRNRNNERWSFLTGVIPVKLKKKDMIFTMDSNWSLDGEYLEYLRHLSNQGVRVVPLFYDLIPMTHPQFLFQNISEGFKDWLDTMIEISDDALAISESTRKRVESYASENKQKINIKTTYLGSDFAQKMQPKPVDERLVNRFVKDARPNYIVLGAIEPRKNHELVYNCFEQMWSEGYKGNLTFVGRITPLYANLETRIRHSRYFDDFMFIEQNMEDADLAFCLANATGLISASHAEGFDLPVVEAGSVGADLLVSETDVHREIAQDNAAYFNPNSVESLKQAILENESNNLGNKMRDSWMSWQESGEGMYQALMEMHS